MSEHEFGDPDAELEELFSETALEQKQADAAIVEMREMATQALLYAQEYDIPVPAPVSNIDLTPDGIACALADPKTDQETVAFLINLTTIVGLFGEYADTPETTLARVAAQDTPYEDQLKWVRIIEDISGKQLLGPSEDANRELLAQLGEEQRAQDQAWFDQLRAKRIVHQALVAKLVADYGMHDDTSTLASMIISTAHRWSNGDTRIPKYPDLIPKEEFIALVISAQTLIDPND